MVKKEEEVVMQWLKIQSISAFLVDILSIRPADSKEVEDERAFSLRISSMYLIYCSSQLKSSAKV